MSSELTDAIAVREREPEPQVPAVTAAFGPPDQARILAYIGLNPGDIRAHAVVLVAERYGLDPLMNHIIILPKSGRPYITVDGFRHIALAHPQYDGMEITEGPTRVGGEWYARVAVYRKDKGHPFEMPGWAEVGRDNSRDMAITRAKRRAFREAFDVSVPPAIFADDDDDDRPVIVAQSVPPDVNAAASDSGGASPAPGGTPSLTASQRTQIQAGFKAIGVTDRKERLELITVWLGGVKVESVNALTTTDADEVLARLVALREDAQQTESDEPGEAAEGEQLASKPDRSELIKLLGAAGITQRPDALSMISGWAGREITDTAELTVAECAAALTGARAIRQPVDDDEGDTGS